MANKIFFLTILLMIFVLQGFGQGESNVIFSSSADRIKQQGEPNPNFGYFIPKYPENSLSKESKEKIKVTNSERNEFKNSNDGIFKLWNNLCINPQVVNVVKDQDCLKTSDLIAASYYSFEAKEHLKLGANICLVDGSFLNQNNDKSFQIIVDLGEKKLESVNNQSAEVVDLLAFSVFDKKERSIKNDEILKDFRFLDKVSANANHSYLLRSVFWDRYNLAPQFKETLYAFQIVNYENNMAIVIWKKLASSWL